MSCVVAASFGRCVKICASRELLIFMAGSDVVIWDVEDARQLGKMRLNSIGSEPSITRMTGVEAVYFF